MPIFSNSSLRNGVDAPLLGMIAFFPTALILVNTSPMPTDEKVTGWWFTLIPSDSMDKVVLGPTETTVVFATASCNCSSLPTFLAVSNNSLTAFELIKTE